MFDQKWHLIQVQHGNDKLWNITKLKYCVIIGSTVIYIQVTLCCMLSTYKVATHRLGLLHHRFQHYLAPRHHYNQQTLHYHHHYHHFQYIVINSGISLASLAADNCRNLFNTNKLIAMAIIWRQSRDHAFNKKI